MLGLIDAEGGRAMRFATVGGMFAVGTYQPYSEGAKRGLHCVIHFHVTSTKGQGGKIGLIQACQATQFINGSWQEYLTSDAQDEKVSSDGWFIDAGGSRNPVFGMRVKSNLSTVEANKIQNGQSSQGGLHGTKSKFGTNHPTELDPAFLEDRPSRTATGNPIRHHFETAAVLIEGEWKGEVLGALTWGYEIDAQRTLTLVTPAAADAVTANWRGAAEAWNLGAGLKVPLK